MLPPSWSIRSAVFAAIAILSACVLGLSADRSKGRECSAVGVISIISTGLAGDGPNVTQKYMGVGVGDL